MRDAKLLATLELPSAELLHQPHFDTLDDPVETAFFARLVSLAVKTLAARSVLDVGCGCGIPTLAAARAGAQRVLGIDIMQCNVALARANIQRARLEHRVGARRGSWEDVCAGRLAVGNVDLVVANPPYVPSARGVAVDGGPTGTRMLEALIAGFPDEARGLALLFGSISDPLHVLERLEQRGFEICELLVQSVPFGRYTSRPPTLARLKQLRAQGRAWFCDAKASVGGAPHAYLTLGIVARLSTAPLGSSGVVHARLARLLADYQRHGPSSLEER